MSLRHLITPYEYDILKDLRVGYEDCSSETERFMPNYNWLETWNTAKTSCNPLLSFFSENLILEKAISFDRSSYTHWDAMQKLHNSELFATLHTRAMDAIQKYNSLGRTWRLLDALNNVNNWVENKYLSTEDIEIFLPTYKTYTLRAGCKLFKAYQTIAKKFGFLDVFEPVRLKHSMILNTPSKEFITLHLSIHPIDYLTASLNKNNWRSCMRWDGGEFREGVIEMMNSPYVVVAYTSSDHEFLDFGVNKWNSKTWREFFIVCPQGIFGIKGYPNWSKDLEHATLNWLRELVNPLSSVMESGLAMS